jgi:hypothetical protein
VPDQEEACAIEYLSGTLGEPRSWCKGVMASLASGGGAGDDMVV